MTTEPNAGGCLVDGVDASVALTGEARKDHLVTTQAVPGSDQPVRALRAPGVPFAAVTPCCPWGVER